MRRPIPGDQFRTANGTIFYVTSVETFEGVDGYCVEVAPAEAVDDLHGIDFSFTDFEFEEFCELEGRGFPVACEATFGLGA